jgi:hypothetical protein
MTTKLTQWIEELAQLKQAMTDVLQEPPKDRTDYKELLTLSVGELRRLYDHVSTSFDNLRTKGLALLAGEVAIVTFLFSADGSHKALLAHQTPVYGIIFYGVGIFLLALAFLALLYVIASVPWKHPPDHQDVVNLTDRFNDSPIKFLEYLQREYLACISHCAGLLTVKAKRFMWAVYSLSLGIFIVLMLKYGGGILTL